MSELTALDSKLGEVIGLAMAAKGATQKIEKLVEDEHVVKSLRKMHDDSAKVEEMGTELISSEDFAGKKTKILEQARTTKGEVTEMMETYLGDDADGLDGLEFLTLAEAAEVGHWKIVEKLNEQIQSREIKELTDFVIPLEEQHFAVTLENSLLLAAQEDALAPA
ncbi:MAG: hypothetical protein JWM86_1804 [Thermoleophilia bacterium]|nr:hypothetical protein [Thermoleophilia bacterium]